ncbi:MAG: copper amine oxidase N-terminal domain-containing protein [Ruminococcaceae bacterium]|nr:copper amine oxidase N-terminal domain-containing protein [Oscillospiraceae bacterium]
MKRVFCIILILTFVLSSIPYSFAQGSDIKVVINGKEEVYDQNPIIVNGRTLVPMRAIFESLGATVEWNDIEKSVTAKKNSTTIKIGIGKKYATVNDKSIKLDTYATIVNGRTLVPVRFVSESLGAVVNWNDAERKVEITYQELYTKKLDFENITSFKDYLLGGGMPGKVTVEEGIDHSRKTGQYLKIEGFLTKSHRFKIHDIFPPEYVGERFTVSMWVMSPEYPSLVVVGAYGETNTTYATRPTVSEGYEIEAGKWTKIVFENVSASKIATMLGIYQDKSNLVISPVLYTDDIEVVCTKTTSDTNEALPQKEIISQEIISALENANLTIDYSFNDIESIPKSMIAGGANYNLNGLAVSDIYDVDDNGRSLLFGARSKPDHRIKVANAFSPENIGKKYVISMWVYIPQKSSKIKVSTFGVVGTAFAYTASDFKEFPIPKDEWTQVAFITEHKEELVTMVGIEQVAGSNVVSEMYIDDIKIGVIE